ncbi:hypothetical protein [Rhizobium sp. OAE497]|uniref:hypothetical protein n=1 Tax=Rhizobium sp. OAE497 TaxID=2663796 RepID=UPI0018F527D0
MTLPMFPLLLEIHYRCADSPDNQWIVLDAAFAEAELELLQTGIEQGFIACDTNADGADVADYYRLSLTERARRQFGLPKPAVQTGLLRQLARRLFARSDKLGG